MSHMSWELQVVAGPEGFQDSNVMYESTRETDAKEKGKAGSQLDPALISKSVPFI